jgi:hypothetical protein
MDAEIDHLARFGVLDQRPTGVVYERRDIRL